MKDGELSERDTSDPDVLFPPHCPFSLAPFSPCRLADCQEINNNSMVLGSGAVPLIDATMRAAVPRRNTCARVLADDRSLAFCVLLHCRGMGVSIARAAQVIPQAVPRALDPASPLLPFSSFVCRRAHSHSQDSQIDHHREMTWERW